MKPSLVFAALAVASSWLFACSGGSTGTTGENTTNKPAGTSSDNQPTAPAPDKPSTGQTCKSSSLNGRCTAGPSKGSSCCYAPENADDPPCAVSNECSNVCRYCE